MHFPQNDPQSPFYKYYHPQANIGGDANQSEIGKENNHTKAAPESDEHAGPLTMPKISPQQLHAQVDACEQQFQQVNTVNFKEETKTLHLKEETKNLLSEYFLVRQRAASNPAPIVVKTEDAYQRARGLLSKKEAQKFAPYNLPSAQALNPPKTTSHLRTAYAGQRNNNPSSADEYIELDGLKKPPLSGIASKIHQAQDLYIERLNVSPEKQVTYTTGGNVYKGFLFSGNGVGTISYANRDVFTGFIIENRPNGCGEMVYADKSKYSGKWVDGRKNGEGIETHSDGTTCQLNYRFGRLKESPQNENKKSLPAPTMSEQLSEQEKQPTSQLDLLETDDEHLEFQTALFGEFIFEDI